MGCSCVLVAIRLPTLLTLLSHSDWMQNGLGIEVDEKMTGDTKGGKKGKSLERVQGGGKD